jgi:hypothetical protein
MGEHEYNANSVDAIVARLETKLDTALNALVEQNHRLGVLETAENKRSGALVAIGIACSGIATGLTLFVEYIRGK